MCNDYWLFVSDVDDTLLGDDEALVRLSQVLQTAVDHVIVAYNSSRPCASLRRSMAATPHLHIPDYLIGAMGTEIQDGASGKQLDDYMNYLDTGWQRERIAVMMKEMGFTAHPAEYQTNLKASYDVPNPEAYTQVVYQLASAGIDAKVIYSGGKNLDIIPSTAGKGNVIRYLRQKLEIPPEQVVVAGDSGNDLEMFVAPYRGIVVANAAPELKKVAGEHIYHARSAYAAGVHEGLRFWQIV